MARFRAEEAAQGNGSAAVRIIDNKVKNAGEKATRIRKKSNTATPSEYLTQRIDEIAVQAVDRLEGLVRSNDEAIATRNVHFVIEQQRGKAVQKNENRNLNFNIEAVL